VSVTGSAGVGVGVDNELGEEGVVAVPDDGSGCDDEPVHAAHATTASTTSQHLIRAPYVGTEEPPRKNDL
jgi:hypothetical protein